MESHRHDEEVHRADPTLRRQLLLVLVLALLIGGAGLIALQFWLDSLLMNLGKSDPEHLHWWLQRLMGGAGLLVGSGIGAGAFWLYRLADDSRSQQRWPPQELRVSQDIRIRTNADALKIARELRISAVAFGLLAAAVLLWSLWLGWPGPD